MQGFLFSKKHVWRAVSEWSAPLVSLRTAEASAKHCLLPTEESAQHCLLPTEESAPLVSLHTIEASEHSLVAVFLAIPGETVKTQKGKTVGHVFDRDRLGCR